MSNDTCPIKDQMVLNLAYGSPQLRSTTQNAVVKLLAGLERDALTEAFFKFFGVLNDADDTGRWPPQVIEVLVPFLNYDVVRTEFDKHLHGLNPGAFLRNFIWALPKAYESQDGEVIDNAFRLLLLNLDKAEKVTSAEVEDPLASARSATICFLSGQAGRTDKERILMHCGQELFLATELTPKEDFILSILEQPLNWIWASDDKEDDKAESTSEPSELYRWLTFVLFTLTCCAQEDLQLRSSRALSNALVEPHSSDKLRQYLSTYLYSMSVSKPEESEKAFLKEVCRYYEETGATRLELIFDTKCPYFTKPYYDYKLASAFYNNTTEASDIDRIGRNIQRCAIHLRNRLIIDGLTSRNEVVQRLAFSALRRPVFIDEIHGSFELGDGIAPAFYSRDPNISSMLIDQMTQQFGGRQEPSGEEEARALDVYHKAIFLALSKGHIPDKAIALRNFYAFFLEAKDVHKPKVIASFARSFRNIWKERYFQRPFSNLINLHPSTYDTGAEEVNLVRYYVSQFFVELINQNDEENLAPLLDTFSNELVKKQMVVNPKAPDWFALWPFMQGLFLIALKGNEEGANWYDGATASIRAVTVSPFEELHQSGISVALPFLTLLQESSYRNNLANYFKKRYVGQSQEIAQGERLGIIRVLSAIWKEAKGMPFGTYEIIEEIVTKGLDDPCPYVASIATLAIQEINS